MEPSTSTTTTKLLWLTTPRISNKQGTIVTNKNILNLALDTDAHVDTDETTFPYQEDWFQGLETEDFWFNQLDGSTADLDQSMVALVVDDGNRVVLVAKALNLLQFLYFLLLLSLMVLVSLKTLVRRGRKERLYEIRVFGLFNCPYMFVFIKIKTSGPLFPYV
jgi:hypothetical protein